MLQIIGTLGELDEPLVAALRILVHEHRGCRVLQYLGTRLLTGVGQAFLGIVDNQLLAEGIDEVLRAAGDDELIGVGRCELHRIADLVAPEAAGGGDNHRVVLAFLHAPEGYRVATVHGDELIEDTVVEHQQHRLVGWIILDTEESLAGVVGLHIVHPGRGDELFVLLTVRRESHTAVEEHLDVGPHLLQVLLARHLHHTGEYGEHPGGDAREVGDVLVHRLTGNALTLQFEVGEQGRLLLRHPHEVDQRVDVLDEDGREVAHERIAYIVVGCMAAAEDQSLAIEHPRLGIVPQVEDHGIAAAGIMDLMESLTTDGDEL